MIGENSWNRRQGHQSSRGAGNVPSVSALIVVSAQRHQCTIVGPVFPAAVHHKVREGRKVHYGTFLSAHAHRIRSPEQYLF